MLLHFLPHYFPWMPCLPHRPAPRLTLSSLLLSSQSFSLIPSHQFAVCITTFQASPYPQTFTLPMLHFFTTCSSSSVHPIQLPYSGSSPIWLFLSLALNFLLPDSLSCPSMPSLPLAASCSPCTPPPDTPLREVPQPPEVSLTARCCWQKQAHLCFWPPPLCSCHFPCAGVGFA